MNSLSQAHSCVTDGNSNTKILINIVCIKVRFMVQIKKNPNNVELSKIAEDRRSLKYV